MTKKKAQRTTKSKKAALPPLLVSTPLLANRASGVLMHITSLPSKFGIGDLGLEAYRFVDFCAAGKQKFWQTLPINPIGCGNSPYSTISSFAGEPLLISPELLLKKRLLTAKEVRGAARGSGSAAHVNYEKAWKRKSDLLRLAFSRFKKNAAWHAFIRKHKNWLDSYSAFCALAKHFETRNWTNWPKPFRNPNSTAVKQAKRALQQEIDYFIFEQFLFEEQWQALRKYAQSKGVGLIGDIPIFVSHESADVWGCQKYFALKPDGKMRFVAGVPPDYFNPDGQMWGNALYNWPALKRDKFSWWCARVERQLELFDLIRIDHFIGFYRYWQIPAGARNGRRGTWKLTPGWEFLNALKRNLGGSLPLIAEDLGLITKEVVALREGFHLLGMKVLQFGFARDGSASLHLSTNFDKNFVVYTGTHDNPTTVGWYDEAYRGRRSKKSSYDYQTITRFLDCKRSDVAQKLCWEAEKSVAQLAVLPLQDILGLAGKTRMNIPGVGKGQWSWRVKPGQLQRKHASLLAQWTKLSGRA